MVGEQLVMVVHPEPGQNLNGRCGTPRLAARNAAPAALQTHQRILALGRRFSANRVAENQTRNVLAETDRPANWIAAAVHSPVSEGTHFWQS